MKISVQLHTTDYRGDHSADVCQIHEVREGETVDELAARLLTRSEYNRKQGKRMAVVQPNDYVVIRPVVETDE